MSSKMELMRSAYKKLDNMVLSFGLPEYDDAITDISMEKYLGIEFKDTMREMRLTDASNVEEMSIDEMQIENRIVYYALKRFRNSASVFFKFSTAVDGKTVDKSMIPKMLSAIIAEYDKEFRVYRSSSLGKLWAREGTSSIVRE